MKKALFIVAILALLSATAFGLAACDSNGEEQHEHSYGEWQVTLEADCQHNGQRERTCSTCGNVEVEIITDGAHKPVTVTGTPATCEKPGISDGQQCSVCGATLVEQHEIEPLGHQFNAWHTIVESTCTEQGYEQQECQNCTVVQKRNLALKPHNYGEWQVTREASCSLEGEKYRQCEDCPQRDVQSIDKTQHTYGDWHNIQPSTCSVAGVDQRECSACGGGIETRPAEKLQHTRAKLDGYPATCDEDGREDGEECSVCHEVLSGYEIISKLGHSWGKWTYVPGTEYHEHTCINDPEHKEQEPCSYNITTIEPTCVSAGYYECSCVDCNHSFQRDGDPAKGHSYGPWIKNEIEDEREDGHTHTHTHYCRSCEASETKPCQLNFSRTVDPDCVMAGYSEYVCEDCGVVHEDDIVEANGHSFVIRQSINKAPPTHWQDCTVCGYKTEEQRCSYEYQTKEATCTENGYTEGTCKVCSRKTVRSNYVGMLGHDWTDGWHHDEPSELEPDKHTHSRTCKRCFMTQQDECRFVADNVAPTCTSAGKNARVCEVCFISITDNEIQELGHKYGEWFEDEDNPGYHYQICENDRNHINKQPCNFNVYPVLADCENGGGWEKECNDCGYITFEADLDSHPLGHNYQISEITATGHKAVCLNDPEHIFEGNHDWSESNFCAVCQHDGITYKKESAHYIAASSEKVKNSKKIIIPSTHKELGDESEYPVVKIGASFMLSNKSCTQLVIAPSITNILTSAFQSCTALRSVEFQKDESGASHLDTLAYHAFSYCTSLERMELPDSVTKLEQSVFRGCTALQYVSAGDALIDIGVDAFTDTGLINNRDNWLDGGIYVGKHLVKVKPDVGDTFEIKEDTISISSNAFSDCKTIKTVIMHNKITEVDNNAFENCTSLEKVEFTGSLREWLKIHFANDYASPLHYAANLHISEAFGAIEIPEDVTRIPAGTFRNTAITSVVMHPGVVYIGEDAFADCASLESINIPDTVRYIGADILTNSAIWNDPAKWDETGALYVDKHLIAVDPEKAEGAFTIKDTTLTIAPGAFKDCEKITSISIPTSVVYIGAGVIIGCGVKQISFVDPSTPWLATNSGITRVVGGNGMVKLTDPVQVKALFDYYTGQWTKYTIQQ